MRGHWFAGKSMSFHKKETEKIELVARPETDQTQLNLLTDMVENN